MIIPPLQGNFTASDYFIYAACDEKYFDDFGRILIASIKKNSNDSIHIHIYNPRQDQLEFCQQQEISYTYEFVSLNLFEEAANKWNTIPEDPIAQHNYNRIQTAMKKGGDTSIAERIQKTYFACARFIRLNQILSKSSTVLSIDVDAVVRTSIPRLSAEKDFYIHQILGKKARFLAGGLYLNSTGKKFLEEYSAVLEKFLTNDDIHWGLDQDVLDPLVPKYNFGVLPMRYIDWNMSLDSYIWTAKGTRKDNLNFISEQKKYIS